MKLGKKQTAYGVVLGLAAAGFVVDRLCFTPAGADAAPIAADTPATSQKPAAAPAPTETVQVIPAGWLADRLRTTAVSSDNDLRDVFAAPASWKPAPKVVAVAAVPAAPQLLGDQFRHDHHLEAVVIRGKSSRAVVDGQLVSVGGMIAGFQLEGISTQSAQFTHGSERVSLTLANSDAAPVR